MAVTSPAPSGATTAHEPSALPDPKAWFSRLAAFSARRRRLVIGFWLLVTLAAAPLAITLTGALSGAGWEAQGSTAQQVRGNPLHVARAVRAAQPVHQDGDAVAGAPARRHAVVQH